jgi:hypothetical protein
VEDVRPGQLLLGDDGAPRRVLGVCAGEDPMYRVSSPGSDAYVVNECHVLTLCVDDGFGGVVLADLPLTHYLAVPLRHRSRLQGVRAVRGRLVPTGPVTVTFLGTGAYHGFELDGNGRFQLGDGTLTHNTTIAIYLLCQLRVRTLIVVHKDFLMQQWRERLRQFAPGARLGLIKASKLDVRDTDVVLASLQTLAMKELPASSLEGFGLVIADEVHRMCARVMSRALCRTCTHYSMGLSATVNRKDGLGKVMRMFFGEVLSRARRRVDGVDVVAIPFYDPDPRYSAEVLITYTGKLNISRMINNITQFEPRTRMVLGVILRVLAAQPARRVLVLSDRIALLRALGAGLARSGVASGMYVGGMKQAALDLSAAATVLLATNAYASEGMDIGGLDTLVLASPKSDVEQAVGRVMRDRTGSPLILDIVDGFSLFERQAAKRAAFYRRRGYRLRGSLEEALGLGPPVGGWAPRGEGPPGRALGVGDDDDASSMVFRRGGGSGREAGGGGGSGREAGGEADMLPEGGCGSDGEE